MLGAPAMRRSYLLKEASQLTITAWGYYVYAGFDRAVHRFWCFRTRFNQSYAATRTLDNRPFFRATYSTSAVFGFIGVQLP